MRTKESIITNEYTYTAIFEPDGEGGYTVTVPVLRGLVTQGDTLEEARERAVEAIEGYLELLQERAIPIPASEDQTPQTIEDKLTVKLQTA